MCRKAHSFLLILVPEQKLRVELCCDKGPQLSAESDMWATA